MKNRTTVLVTVGSSRQLVADQAYIYHLTLNWERYFAESAADSCQLGECYRNWEIPRDLTCATTSAGGARFSHRASL